MTCLMFSLMFPASLLYCEQRLIALCYSMVQETWKTQGETERSKKEYMRDDFEHQDRFHLVIVTSTHISAALIGPSLFQQQSLVALCPCSTL